jgi:hypothetical protein
MSGRLPPARFPGNDPRSPPDLPSVPRPCSGYISSRNPPAFRKSTPSQIAAAPKPSRISSRSSPECQDLGKLFSTNSESMHFKSFNLTFSKHLPSPPPTLPGKYSFFTFPGRFFLSSFFFIPKPLTFAALILKYYVRSCKNSRSAI